MAKSSPEKAKKASAGAKTAAAKASAAAPKAGATGKAEAPKRKPAAKAAVSAPAAAAKPPKAPASKPAAARPVKPQASPKLTTTAKPTTAASKAPTKSKPAAQPKTTATSKAPAKAKAAAKPKAAPKPKPAPRQETPAKEVAAVAAPSSDASKAKAAAVAMPKATAPEGLAPLRSADKPWLKNYPKGLAAEIGPLEDRSIGDLLVKACRKFATRPAFTCMDKSLSYAELEKMSAAFGAYLQSKGLKKGARVAIMMPNVLQYPVAIMGVLRAGYTVVNVNPLYTPRELEHQLKDSGAEAIVILENFATTLQAVIGKTSVKHVVVATMGDLLGFVKGTIVNFVVRRVKKLVPAWSLPGHTSFPAALKDGAARVFKPADVSPDDVAFLQYTGGTTGISKGATLIHRNVLANVEQLAIWVEDAYTVKPKPENLVYVCALPLYHIFALTVNAMMGMQQGAQNLLIPNPRDIPSFVKELAKQPFHIFPGLNTLFNALLNNEDFRKIDFKPLVLTLGGGMAVQRGVAERWKELTGCSITEGYGLSETSPVATANRVNGAEFTGTIGLPLPSTEIAIRDDDGNDLPLGEVGEICIKGPQVMTGYWNRADETAKVMTKDGFFKSGDMGFMDERGFTKIVDRKKDMILVSGFNVYPNELEEVVAQMPGVLEVAAIGVPDEHSGEIPKLFIVKKDQALTEDQVFAYCRNNLTGYKRPRHIEFRKELPKTPVGKILRRELRG